MMSNLKVAVHIVLCLMFGAMSVYGVSDAISSSWDVEYSRLQYEIQREKGDKPWYSLSKVKDFVYDEQALVTTSDNSPVGIALRRLEALLDDMENTKFVATAGAHHGSLIGSNILIDISIPDDGVMSQIRRFTPEIQFKESEEVKDRDDRPMAASPYPLNEKYMLCTYVQDSHKGELKPPYAGGIYLIDAFGNRTLIYEDKDYNCYSPIPVKKQQTPPIIPTRTSRGEDGNKSLGTATIAVSNIYESDFDWPENTKITAMRIIQIFPKYTSAWYHPQIGYSNMSTARGVLGVVPVEEDGSVYCEAPVGKVILFQALDENGMAVQSMRSATYVHEGEQLSCTGCHEDKWSVTAVPGTPSALTRPPSKLTPDVEGSMPMQFTRLVQPVLEAKCAPCHKEKDACDLSSTPLYEVYPEEFARNDTGPKSHMTQFWTIGYKNLEDYVYHVHGGGNGAIGNGSKGASRTLAGSFGAHASELLQYLDSTHHGVKLTQEEYYRFTLWMDCNSEFYGAYHNTEKQGKGELVKPLMDYTEEAVAISNTDMKMRPPAAGAVPMRISVQSSALLVHGVPANASIALYNPAGRIVKSIGRHDNTPVRLNRRIPVSIAGGVYLVHVNLPGGERHVLPVSIF